GDGIVPGLAPRSERRTASVRAVPRSQRRAVRADAEPAHLIGATDRRPIIQVSVGAGLHGGALEDGATGGRHRFQSFAQSPGFLAAVIGAQPGAIEGAAFGIA